MSCVEEARGSIYCTVFQRGCSLPQRACLGSVAVTGSLQDLVGLGQNLCCAPPSISSRSARLLFVLSI